MASPILTDSQQQALDDLLDELPANTGLFRGDGGDNTLIGTASDDLMWGLGGNDILVGGPGRDLLEGGSGDDELYAGDRAGYYSIYDYGGYAAAGGVTEDSAAIGDGMTAAAVTADAPVPDSDEAASPEEAALSDESAPVEEAAVADEAGALSFPAPYPPFHPEPPQDHTPGDIVRAGAGDDIIYVADGDFVDGGPGNDSVWLYANARVVDASDWIGVENIFVNEGNVEGVTLTGPETGTRLSGGLGSDRIEGGDGDDVIMGGPWEQEDGGADELYGNGGDDLFLLPSGPVSDTIIDGGEGYDTLRFPMSWQRISNNDLRHTELRDIERIEAGDDTNHLWLDAARIGGLDEVIIDLGGETRGPDGEDTLHLLYDSTSGEEAEWDETAGTLTVTSEDGSALFTLADVERLVLHDTGGSLSSADWDTTGYDLMG
ncbi:calcium-binding protein [Telmatospirillum sp. J64-1]|uniref:calcium-binding protein n=1 Tax=Telmatospirillum sp. J64-1 TaxID=2502183 RepID=UPI00115CDF8B|nr:calcium-binding protein [Telmatospirillum sp. J64-1]